ncbi:MAG: ABC transporter permease [Actinomycetota bacterium]
MWRATLKGILAHRWRLIRTAIAVALGVGFVAGTFVITDTTRSRIDSIMTTSQTGSDVTVTSASKFGEARGANVEPISASVLPTIRAVPGVQKAVGEVWGSAIVVGSDGKPIQPLGPPQLGAAWGSASLELARGAAPTGEWDVAIDEDTAAAQHFEIGDLIRVILQDSSKQFRIVGFVKMPDAWTGATLSVFSMPTAQRLMDVRGRFTSISVTADAGVTPETLRERILPVLPKGTEAKTASEVTAETEKTFDQVLGIFQSVLLAFALVALFVGAFLIFNTFSILVAQRTREIGLLRAVGASRRQVLGSVLGESAALGLLASVFGLAFGVVLAIGLFRLMSGGSNATILAGTSLQVTARTVLVAIVAGVVVTVLAALMPARRATQVSPVVAIDGRVEPRPGAVRRRVLVGGTLTAAGIAALLGGLFANVPNPMYLIGAGALLQFVGIATLSVLFARPLAAAVGRPFAAVFGECALLGRQNSMRAPSRTASTAAALMVGVGLVAFVTIAATSIKASATDVIRRDMRADFVIQSSAMSGWQQTGVSPGISRELQRDLSIGEVSEIRQGQFGLNGRANTVFAVDPYSLKDMIAFDPSTQRSLDALNDVGVLVRRRVAQAEGWHVGQNLPMQYQRVGVVPTPIQGFFVSDALNGSDYLITIGEYERRFVQQLDAQVLVKGTPGSAMSEIRTAIDKTLVDYPNVTAMNQAQYADAQAKQIDALLVFVQALLALSVIIALFGIANTLSMSILERRRELGLLRAVGMTRGQLRAMVRWEAVVIGLIGALLGLVVGTFFGWAMVRALRDQGFNVFAVPFVRLAVYVVLGAVAGVVAALLPARRAARLNVLEAIAAE